MSAMKPRLDKTRNGSASRMAAPEVLTLREAADYLRVSEDDVLKLIDARDLPGRRIGKEWRFLKSGLRDWLKTPARPSAKKAMLALAGAWKDDPDIDEIVRQAHQRRGRRAERE